MIIDITKNFQEETTPLDADRHSPTLQEYHRILWSKTLPNGQMFELKKISDNRLYHKSSLGEFYLSSDRVIPTFTKRLQLRDIVSSVPKDKLNHFINLTETIGGITIWPSNRVNNMMTINGAKGFNNLIGDRLDLTLECIRRYYLNQNSPLFNTLKRYEEFFQLFENFKGYIDFFLFQDFVTKDYKTVRIAPPFNNFESVPIPKTAGEYLEYMNHTEKLIDARNKRILDLY